MSSTTTDPPPAQPNDGVDRAHRQPRSLLALTIVMGIAIIAGLMPVEHWPALCLLIAVGLLAHAVAGTELQFLGRRLLTVVPWLGALAVALVLSRPSPEALLAGWAIVLRGTVAFLAALWLMQVTTSGQLLKDLRTAGTPMAIVTTLGLMLRFIALLWDEYGRLTRAQGCRGGGPRPGWETWHASLQRFGLVTVRALDRADRVHRAMQARGGE